MDMTLFNSTVPVITTELQQASSHFRGSQTAFRRARSTLMASPQIAQGPRPLRGSLDPSLSRDSLASSSSLESDVDLEIQSYHRGSVE
jgi:hypothetical protein